METDLDLFESARAHTRRSDPDTSHAAAAHVQGTISEACQAVLKALKQRGPCSDEELQDFYDARRAFYKWPPQRCVRKRRKDLVDAGLVEYTGEKTMNPVGMMVRTWQVKR